VDDGTRIFMIFMINNNLKDVKRSEALLRLLHSFAVRPGGQTVVIVLIICDHENPRLSARRVIIAQRQQR